MNCFFLVKEHPVIRYDFGGIWAVSSDNELTEKIVHINNATEALITYKETEINTAVLNPKITVKSIEEHMYIDHINKQVKQHKAV